MHFSKDPRFWRHPITLLGLLTLSGTLGVYLWPGFDVDIRAAYALQVGELPLRLLVIIALVRVLPKPREPAERAFWVFTTLAFASWFLADLIFQAVEGGQPLLLGVLEDGSFALFFVGMILALEQRADRYPLPVTRSASRFWIAVTALALMLWLYGYLTVITAVIRPDIFLTAQPSYIFFTVADALLIALLAARVIVSRGRWCSTYSLLAVALFAWSIGDILDSAADAGTIELGYGTLADFLWYCPYLLVIAAAVQREIAPGRLRTISEDNGDAPVRVAFLYACIPPVVHLVVYSTGWLSELELSRELTVVGGTGMLLVFAGLAHRAARKSRKEVHVIVLDEEFQRTQKLEALGGLAGGIAHDFNNLLMILQSQVELMSPELSRIEGGEELVGNTRSAVDQGSALTRRLLAFGRQSTTTVESFSPHEAIAEAEVMIRRTLGEHIDVSVSAQSHSWDIEMDRNQLIQVLINLALNARSAMPDGGQLSISMRNVKLDGLRKIDRASSDFVQIDVVDSGLGMDEATRARVFEPFFTTRAETGGTGLGLSVCHGIVRQAGGYISCDSEPNEGTRFRIHLPRAVHERQNQISAAEEAIQGRLGDRTILLAEDESKVRTLTAAYLRSEGFHVLEASDGDEALAVGAAYRGRIDLLLTDVVMPRLGGVELAERFAAVQRSTPVLFVSGYARDLMSRDRHRDGPVHFMQKPYSMVDLKTRMQGILEGAG